MANPLVLAFAQLVYSQDNHHVSKFSASCSDVAARPSQALASRLPRDITSAPVIAGTFALALRANTGNERAVYAMLTFLLFVASKMLQLYKTPSVSHVIFVVDMFNVCVEVSFSDATSSVVSCVAATSIFGLTSCSIPPPCACEPF